MLHAFIAKLHKQMHALFFTFTFGYGFTAAAEIIEIDQDSTELQTYSQACTLRRFTDHKYFAIFVSNPTTTSVRIY